MNKSGGTTVKYLLQPWIDSNGIRLGLYDSPQWKMGAAFAEKFVRANVTLTWGGYVEGLRRHGAGTKCRWFTVFRHPMTRVVSAFYYCQDRPDVLCANLERHANMTDFQSFAEHWSNFGLRQFAMGMVLPDMVTAFPPAQECVRKDPRCPGWYMLKMFLDARHSNATGGVGDIPDASMMRNMLQPAQEILRDKYAAVGILEKYDSTLRLFNAALEMPDFDWVQAYKTIGSKNRDGKNRKRERDTVQEALTNPAVKRFISLDLLLYEHALEVNAAQLKQYGIA